MTTPLSTTARRHVRLTREALDRDARQAMAILGPGATIKETFRVLERRLNDLAPKKRIADVIRCVQAIANSAPSVSNVVATNRQSHVVLITIPATGGHAYSSVAESATTLVTIRMHLRRNRWECGHVPIASIGDHLLGRAHERAGLSVAAMLDLVARVAVAALRLVPDLDDDGRQVHLAVGDLVLAGIVRVFVGAGQHGKVAGTFIDFRTALTRAMVDTEVAARADALAALDLTQPSDRAAIGPLKDDYISRHVTGSRRSSVDQAIEQGDTGAVLDGSCRLPATKRVP